MEYIKDCFYTNRYFYITLFLLFMGFVLWFCLRGSGTADVGNSTDRTMDRIETKAKSAGSSLSDARGKVEYAEDSIQRAQDAVESGQRAAEEVSDGISECQDLTSKSRKLNTDIAGLIRNIEAANRQRTQDSEKSPMAK